MAKTPTDEQMRLAARQQWQREGEIEVDDNAEISRADDNFDKGAYVQAWVWVCDADVPELVKQQKEHEARWQNYAASLVAKDA
jgi:hypothetical protein